MTTKLIFFICVFALAPAFAAEFLIKAGMNNSWLVSEGGTSETKPVFGIGLLFPIDEEGKGNWAVNVLYVEQKMILQDKSWPSGVYLDDECRATFGDLYLHYHYLKLPVYLRATIYQARNFYTTANVGASISFTVGSSSHGGNRRSVDGYCDYDYRRITSDSEPRYPVEFMLGTEVGYKAIGLELFYRHTLAKTKYMYGLDIQDHIRSIQVALSWKIQIKSQSKYRKQTQ